MPGEEGIDLVAQYWVSVGALHTAPAEEDGDVVVLSFVAGGGFDGGRQWLIQPREVVFTEDYLLTLRWGGVAQEEVEAHGKTAAATALEALAWLNSHARGRHPVLICADPAAEWHVRRFFAAHASYDPFAQSQFAVDLAARWNRILRHNMPAADYSYRAAALIATDQFALLVELLMHGEHM